MIEVPESVRQKAESLGSKGTRWLVNLDDLVGELEQKWQLTVGSCLSGGSEAYVAKARTMEGSEVVLKLALPEMPGNTALTNEISGLTIADGHGYARLLKHDLNYRALLLEQLGDPLNKLSYSTKEQIDIICTTLKKSWVQQPAKSQLPTGKDIAEWLGEFIADLWKILDKPCSKLALDTAMSFTKERAAVFNCKTAVLVHGDAHNGNTLQDLAAKQLSFKFIDPDGIIAEPAYDLGVLMREWVEELGADPVRLGNERCKYLSHLTGVDTDTIWRWGFIQSMSTGLFLMKVGQERTGIQMLNVAEAWARV